MAPRQKPYPLVSFASADSTRDCRTMSDEGVGGFSTSVLDFHSASSPLSKTVAPCVRWHGSISTALPKDQPDVIRTGFAGWRTLDPGMSLFGRQLWDVEMYKYLAIRLRSDGRKYFVNLQTETIEPTDIHQHRLFAKKVGEWETVHIKWNTFVRTNYGRVVEPQSEMNRAKVRTLGMSTTDRVQGPFEVWIQQAWATNSLDEWPDQATAERMGKSEQLEMEGSR